MAPERAAGARPVRPVLRAAGAAARLAAAIERFLDELELPADVRQSDHLADTPRRVAEAWRDDLLDGYRVDPAAVLGESMPATGRDLVALTGIDYHSMCPHHLLPSRGVAHVAYVPGDRVVGFGQLARLVDCFAHRLVLEEDLARSIADALVRHLGARGAACVLDAEQMCLTVRGERRRHARAHAQAFAGTMARDGALQRRFLAATARERVKGRGAARAAPGKRKPKVSADAPPPRAPAGRRRPRGRLR